jgi:hypothetical protein
MFPALRPPALLIIAFLPASLSCSSATLDVPATSAANPKAHTMPISETTTTLGDDFDPWAGEAKDSEDRHTHHHQAGPEPASADSENKGHDHD